MTGNHSRQHKRATISDVAQMAGVSISTVSRVLNGTAPVAEGTVEQVIRAIEALHYAPHAAARTLAGRHANTIGLLLPEISGAFYAPLIRGIETAAQESGFDLLIHSAPTSSRSWRAQLPLDEHNTDGLLVFTGRLTDQELAQLHARGFPLLLLYRSSPAGLAIPAVILENKAGARQAVEHLITVHRCRRIAFLAGPPGNEDSDWREAGYMEALRRHHIPVDPDLRGVGHFNEVGGREAVQAWMRQGLEFDAIFAGDDETASGAIMALREAGVRVPGDVAVVGFDDVPFARLLVPPLTTVRAPIETVGTTAARHLIDLIHGRPVELVTQLPAELVVRQSCGCP
jgi:DNA-binding LacI/PurR family transcriptional regulator